MVDWKYIYKRRNWTVLIILKSLKDRSWESFNKFHSDRQITCPHKDDFDAAINFLSVKTQPVGKQQIKEVQPKQAKATQPRSRVKKNKIKQEKPNVSETKTGRTKTT
jgi:hypothetical protein